MQSPMRWPRGPYSASPKSKRVEREYVNERNTLERRAEAVAMYAKCKNFRAVAVAFHVSHESVRTWLRGDGRADEVAVKGTAERGPVFRMDGRSLGRVALWT
jgi:hypothetical protein